jgi:orotate phosphoribosyltransferase
MTQVARPDAGPAELPGLDLYSLLCLPDDVIRAHLLTFIRAAGVKFQSRQAFDRLGWHGDPPPRLAKFWSTSDGKVALSRSQVLWDLREPLLHDDVLMCCSILLHRLAQPYKARWIGGMETAAIPIIAGVLAVNRAVGGPPLNGFYIRKKRKPDGLRRLLEGPRPSRGTAVLLVDDILNKGISKRALVNYCANNGLRPSALLIVVDMERRRGAKLFAPLCPIESLFTRQEILDRRGPRD